MDFNTVHIYRGIVLGDYYGTRRPETVFAHTSHHYVVLEGAPLRSWDDAQFYARYLGDCIESLKTGAKFAKPSDRQRSIEAFKRGRGARAALTPSAAPAAAPECGTVPSAAPRTAHR